MSTNFTAGQVISCTVSKLPASIDDRDTIARLMRRDPAAKKSLANAQRKRAQRLLVYNRGNRDWTSRETCAKVVRVVQGQSWSMPFTHDIAPDLAAVQKFLQIAAR